jgi:hypothetical protein
MAQYCSNTQYLIDEGIGSYVSEKIKGLLDKIKNISNEKILGFITANPVINILREKVQKQYRIIS